MIIVKPGKSPKPVEDIPCTCDGCQCHFVFHESEAYSYVDDARDGDYYRVACPNCEVLNSVSVKLKGSARTSSENAS